MLKIHADLNSEIACRWPRASTSVVHCDQLSYVRCEPHGSRALPPSGTAVRREHCPVIHWPPSDGGARPGVTDGEQAQGTLLKVTAGRGRAGTQTHARVSNDRGLLLH